MNNVVYDPVTGQPVQEMQPQLDSMTGMPVQPVAATMPNQAVYNNPMAINAANRIYGSPQMRQNSVMMTKAQENTFGPERTDPNPGIYNAIKNK